MKLLKDLLYTQNNGALEIARACTLLSVLAYWGGVFWHATTTGKFDPVAVGTGCAAIFAGGAAWIHFRQKHEGPSAGEVQP